MNEQPIYEIPVSLTVKLTEEDIDDIMVGALEGGINYWCDEAEVIEEKRVADWGHEQIARGGCLILHDAESDDKWELNLEKFINGVKLWIENGDAFEWEPSTTEPSTVARLTRSRRITSCSTRSSGSSYSDEERGDTVYL